MAVESIVRKVTEYAARLYHRQWEWFEVLALSLVALSLLMILVRARQERNRRRRQGSKPSEKPGDFRSL